MATARCRSPGNVMPRSRISSSRTRNPVSGTSATWGMSSSDDDLSAHLQRVIARRSLGEARHDDPVPTIPGGRENDARVRKPAAVIVLGQLLARGVLQSQEVVPL